MKSLPAAQLQHVLQDFSWLICRLSGDLWIASSKTYQSVPVVGLSVAAQFDSLNGHGVEC